MPLSPLRPPTTASASRWPWMTASLILLGGFSWTLAQARPPIQFAEIWYGNKRVDASNPQEKTDETTPAANKTGLPSDGRPSPTTQSPTTKPTLAVPPPKTDSEPAATAVDKRNPAAVAPEPAAGSASRTLVIENRFPPEAYARFIAPPRAALPAAEPLAGPMPRPILTVAYNDSRTEAIERGRAERTSDAVGGRDGARRERSTTSAWLPFLGFTVGMLSCAAVCVLLFRVLGRGPGWTPVVAPAAAPQSPVVFETQEVRRAPVSRPRRRRRRPAGPQIHTFAPVYNFVPWSAAAPGMQLAIPAVGSADVDLDEEAFHETVASARRTATH